MDWSKEMKFAYAFTDKKNLYKLEQKKDKIQSFVRELVERIVRERIKESGLA